MGGSVAAGGRGNRIDRSICNIVDGVRGVVAIPLNVSLRPWNMYSGLYYMKIPSSIRANKMNHCPAALHVGSDLQQPCSRWGQMARPAIQR